MSTGIKLRHLILAICCVATGLLALPAAVAQSIQLSPEQQRMLNQLPPAQRQQALAALRQMQGQVADQAPFQSLNEPATSPTTVDPVDPNPFLTGGEPVAEASSTLVIRMTVMEGLSRDELESLDDDSARQGLQGSRVFLVDEDGMLELPGVVSVPVGGLTAKEIELRLGAEEALSVFEIVVNVLDPQRTGTAVLETFGYDVFESTDALFDPVTTGPVPPDYVLGPGDSIRVQLFGNVNGIYEYEVTRDGVLNLPELGPITVAGLPFSEFRADLDRRVGEMLIGTQVSTTIGQLRTIRVFVLGDVNRPGSYVVTSLATISSAIYAAGGISDIGSLRDVQLKRRGQTASRLDLYDLLLNGDTSDDARLQPGDVVFVPPVGPQVSVSGAVKRPAIYEIAGGETIDRVIALAGGLSDEAFADGARVERIESGAGRVVLSLGADTRATNGMTARAGDAVFVPEVLPDLLQTIEVFGHVHRPGPYQWRPGMRLTDVIGSMSALLPGADSGYLLIRREETSSRSVSVVSADLEAALQDPSSESNRRLSPRDRIHVFGLEYGRQRVIRPLLEELELQSRFGQPNPVVTVSGHVRAPGTYPLEAGMTVSDLIRAAGQLSEEAYAVKAELVRYDVIDDEYRSTEIVDVDLASVLRGDSSEDIELTEQDNLRISALPEWDTLWTVTLAGEVTFPGEYRIRRGESLTELLERAGGLSEAAFPEGAVFLRESLREREQQQIELLARRLEADLTSLSLQAADTTGSATLTTGRELLAQLQSTEAVGRLVIDLPAIAAGNGRVSRLELRDGDRLLVPKQPQSVTVIGEAQQNTSHLYDGELSRDDYIAKSGGLTRRADKKLIYIVRASGAVEAGDRSRWFGRGGSVDRSIYPGDTIVVPIETDRIRPLTLWSNATQILYNLAIAAAAVNSF